MQSIQKVLIPIGGVGVLAVGLLVVLLMQDPAGVPVSRPSDKKAELPRSLALGSQVSSAPHTVRLASVPVAVPPAPIPAPAPSTPPRSEVEREKLAHRLSSLSSDTSPAAISELLQHVRDADAQVRDSARESLKSVGSAAEAKQLRSWAEAEKDAALRVQLLEAAEFIELPSLSDLASGTKKP